MALCQKIKLNKKLIVSILLGLILVTSTVAIAIKLPPIQPPEPQIPENTKDKVAWMLQGIDFKCYTVRYVEQDYTYFMIYDDVVNQIQNNTRINMTALDFIKRDDVQSYMLDNCKYLSEYEKIPQDAYDPNLGYTKQEFYEKYGEQAGKFALQEQRAEQLTNYNFTEVALEENRIENLAEFFFMAYSDTVKYMMTKGLIHIDECEQQKNSTAVLCTWNESKFTFDKATNRVEKIQ